MSESSNSSTGISSSGKKETDPADQYVEYSILAGDYHSAAKTLENNKQSIAAKTVKFTELAGGFPSQKVTERHRGVPPDANAPQPVALFDLGPDQRELKDFTDSEAKHRF